MRERWARPFKFAQVLADEGYHTFAPHIPTYLSIVAQPSRFPPRHFGLLSGDVAPYTDPETGTRFANLEEFKLLREKMH